MTVIIMQNEKTNFSNLFERLDSIIEKIESIESSIKAISEVKGNTDSNKILNVKEVSKLIGKSEHSIYKLVEKNNIPYHKPTNGHLYFLNNEIIEWITQDQNSIKKNFVNIAAEYNLSRKRFC